MTRRALVTGSSGQDGYYLTRHLAERGREVLGVSLEPPKAPMGAHVSLDIADHSAMRTLIVEFAPHEIYHLAAYHRSSDAKVALTPAEEEELYFRYNVDATRNLLRSAAELVTNCRVFLAASSHVFGATKDFPQTENTPIQPNSLYGIAKAMNLWLGRHYRDSRGLFCATGILYNHESPFRGPSFVTGRIARTVAQIARGETDHLIVGNLDAQVDWGFAGDYVRAMVMVLEADVAKDWIIASGKLHRVRDFVQLAFEHVGLDFRRYVSESAGTYRPVTSAVYFGDVGPLAALGFRPSVEFEELVRMMVDAHL